MVTALYIAGGFFLAVSLLAVGIYIGANFIVKHIIPKHWLQ